MPRQGPGSGRGQRDLRVKVKTARGRKLSSTRWLERQLNDPYVKRAKAEGLSYDFPRLPCDKGAAARHPKYAGQRRGTDREWVGRCGPCGSVIAPVFSHDLNG